VHRYSSLAAFLAHHDTLRKIPPSAIAVEDRNLLAAMEKLLAVLRPEERIALTTDTGNPGVARHRERALLRLRRELLARGVIDG
jgi:hypothetical protein